MAMSLYALHKRLKYDRQTGRFISRKTGNTVGWVKDGYLYIEVMGKKHQAGRLAWFYVKGTWPTLVDHRDCDPLNNRWSNLREATVSQQMANRRVMKINQLGVKGIRRRGNSWQARLTIGHRSVCLGSYATPQEAADAYKQAALQHHGAFARW